MQTARVDMLRLQMLNDCINRTLEALNQVRLSVHGAGLSHSAPFGASFGAALPLAAVAAANPFAANAFVNNALVNNAFANNAFATNPYAFGANAALNNIGIGHTAANPWTVGYDNVSALTNGVDPYVATRIAQTFPFVNWGYSPFI